MRYESSKKKKDYNWQNETKEMGLERLDRVLGIDKQRYSRYV